MDTPMQRRVVELSKHASAPITPLVLDIEGTCATLSLSRTAVYDLLARGELARVKIGRRTLIPVASIRALISRSTQD